MMQIHKVETPDGVMAVQVFRPEGPATTGVILYMDAFGPRPALAGMAERMAALGHVVALPDLFYRHGAYGPFDAATAFAREETAVPLRAMIGATSQDMTVADSAPVLQILAEQGVTGPVAAVGYCMGGGRAISVAAAYPQRIRLAASLHGGNLAADQPGSPHLRLGSVSARVYVGVAGVDRSFPPEQSARLALALREAGTDHLIETYPTCQHGWCVPDHSVFDAEGASRHWRRLEMLFAESLRTW